MGYRSEVAFACYTKDLTPELEEALSDAIKKQIHEKVTIFYYESVKWHNDAFRATTVIESIKNLENACGFIRLGENWTDIDYLGDPDAFGLGYERKIIMPNDFIFNEEELNT